MNEQFLLYWGFIVLTIAVAATVVMALQSTKLSLAMLLWLVVTGALAAAGFLTDFAQIPPRLPILLTCGFAFTVVLAFSKYSSYAITLPISWLIGFQGFRILVEILIHSAVDATIAPPQMSWNGLNFDIITGVSAVIVALISHRLPSAALIAWNYLGLALLLWVVFVGIVSFPTPIQILHPDNTWLAQFPYIWLPAVLVTAALYAHLVALRKLYATA